MTHQYILHTVTPANSPPNQQASTFIYPISIDMGHKGSEHLEEIVKQKTKEDTKAEEDWTPLSGTRSIDTSVVGGFMFQSDAGSDCSIQVTEHGNLPVQILIDREQDFGMFLVVTQRHEEWTTSGKFYLRFLRRAAALDKPCTARMEGPFAGPVTTPSRSDKDSAEDPVSWIHQPVSMDEKEEEQKAANLATGTGTSLPAQSPSHGVFKDASFVPLAGRTGSSEDDEDLTDEEDYHGIGTAALKGTGGGIIPPGM